MDAIRGGEFAAIERLRQRLPPAPPGETWSGDDAAVVTSPPGRLLLTTDAVVVGVHVDLALVSLEDMGWKAVATAVSDVAAMGGEPRWILAGVCGPPDTDLDELGAGMVAAAAAYGCFLVGGDLASAPTVIVTVTVIGEATGGPPVLRSGARPGDTVLVTGPLGASAAGLRTLREGAIRPDDANVAAHRRPRARVAEGAAARTAGATAMIDVSDGLAADLGHLADASGVGFALDEIPVATDATEAEALGGGEDYELAFTAADPARMVAAFRVAGLRPPIVVGRCTADPSERLLRGEHLSPTGWEHPWR